MNAPHTPGPWHNLGPIIHRNGDHVAYVRVSSVGGGETGTPEQRANADLIKAAPELLAQLKALAVQLEAGGMIVPPNVTEAIAKAEGRAA